MNVLIPRNIAKRVGVSEIIQNTNSFLSIKSSRMSPSLLLNDKLRFFLKRVNAFNETNRSGFRTHDDRVCLTALCRELDTFHQLTVRDPCRSKDTVVSCDEIVHHENLRWIFDAHLLTTFNLGIVCW